MKSRQFKINPALPTQLNIIRLRRYIKDINPSYDPAAAARSRRFAAVAIRQRTGGFPGRAPR